MSDINSSVLDIIQLLHYNKKAYTAKTLSETTNLSLEFINKFLSIIEKLTFIKLKKSPSGRIIRYNFNPFSKDIYYYDINCIIKAGFTIKGQYNSRHDIYEDYDYKSIICNLPDEARKNNKILVNDSFSEEQLAQEIIKILSPTVEKTVMENNDFYKNYPLVHEQLIIFEAKKVALENEVSKEIQSNENKKTWFEEETYKAKCGKRTKLNNKTIITGYKDLYKMAKTSYWFDSDPVNEWIYAGPEPIFETKTITVIDFPEEPIYEYEKQRTNKSLIMSIMYHIQELTNYPMKYEKQFIKEVEKNIKLSILEKKKLEIEKEIKKLNSY